MHVMVMLSISVMIMVMQGATQALTRLPGASKSQIRASIWKGLEITVAHIGHAKSVHVLDYMTFNTKNNFWGQVKMSFGQVFFIKFVCYLPQWASGDKT